MAVRVLLYFFVLFFHYTNGKDEQENGTKSSIPATPVVISKEFITKNEFIASTMLVRSLAKFTVFLPTHRHQPRYEFKYDNKM